MARAGKAARTGRGGFLPRHPLDFLSREPHPSRAEAWRRALDAPVDPRDDLRLVARTPEGTRYGVYCRRLPWDSGFFGRSIARLDAVIPAKAPESPVREDLGPVIAPLMALLRRRAVDYAFAEVDDRDVALARALARHGWEPIEHRVTFHRALLDLDGLPPGPCRAATAADVPSLARAAVRMANPYDRFHADPSIPPRDADRMMAEWVRASVEDGFADVVLVPEGPAPGAFGTVKLLQELWEGADHRPARFVLGAVSPPWKGWYARIVAEACRWARSQGASHMILTTQSANGAAVRTCEKLGFLHGPGGLILRIDRAAGAHRRKA